MGSPASGERASADGDSETSPRRSCVSPAPPRGPGLSSKRLMGRLSASLRPPCRQSRRHERQQQLVVAGDGKAARLRSFVAAGGSGGTLHYILQRAVVLNKVEVRRRNGTERYAQVAHHRNGLQKNLRQQHRRTPVEIDAAGMHLLNERAEEAKIAMRRIAKRRAFRRRVHVRNVRADSEMHRHRDAVFVRHGQNARPGLLRGNNAAGQKLPRRLAISDANPLRQLRDFVQVLSGFLGHAELALAKRGLDVFGSVPGKRYLEIVNERRPVHRDSGDKAAIHQVDQHRPKSHLDDVATQAPQNRFALLPRGKNGAEQFAKIARRKKVRKRIQKMGERCISVAGPRELSHADLALSRRQGIRAHLAKYQRLDRVNAHVRTLTVGGKAAGRKPTTASPAGPRSIDSTPSEDRAGIFRDADNRGFLLRGLAESGGHLHGHLRSFAPCPLPWPLTWRTRARTWPV